MSHRTPHHRGFTTIELLVVIGIIVLLISLLIPVVGKVRESARATDTAAWVQQLGGAIEAYHSDFRAYPGPLADTAIRATSAANAGFVFVNPWPADFEAATGATNDGLQRVTMAENMLLGLLGGLGLDTTTPGRVVYDPKLVGGGPMSLNSAQPKRYNAYLEAKNLSWQTVNGKKTGAFFDDAASADDSIIPEFVDTYSEALPILYLRARVGANATGNNKVNNPVITDDPNFAQGRVGPYDLNQIVGYTRTTPSIGVGRKQITYFADGNVATPQYAHGLTDVTTARVMGPVGGGYFYPYDAFPYFRDPSLSNPKAVAGTGHQPPHVPRQKDRFILIAAGADRIYGTNDDITNFGPVVP